MVRLWTNLFTQIQTIYTSDISFINNICDFLYNIYVYMENGLSFPKSTPIRNHRLLTRLCHDYKNFENIHRLTLQSMQSYDDVIKWKHFPRYWPFVRGIHRSPGNSPHKGQWRGTLMFSLICVWIYGWVNNREAGDLRRYRAHYDVIVMSYRTLIGKN